jgi:WD40 repeat protein
MVEPITSWQAVRGPVRAMDFFRHQTGRVLLAVAGTEGAIQLYQPDGGPFTTADGGVVQVAVPRTAPVHDLVHLPRPAGWPDLAAVGGDGITRTYDLTTGEMQRERTMPLREELRVVETFLDPDGTAIIAVAGMGDAVYLWRGDDSEPELLPGHTGPVRALNALRVERRLAVADERGITVWSLDGEGPMRTAFCPGRSRSLAVLREHGQVRLASAAADGIRLWDPETGDELAHFAHHLNVAAVAAFDAEDDEQLLAVASGRTISLWSPATEAPARTQLAGAPAGPVTELARILTGQGTLLAAGDERGRVAVWRLLPRRRVANLVGKHDDWVNSLAMIGSERRRLLASTADDRQVRLWDLTAGQPYGAPIGHPTQVQAAVPVDGDLVTGDQHGRLRRWSVDGVLRWKCETRFEPIRAMTSFRSRGGWRVVSAGGSGHCLMWDAESGQLEQPLRLPVTTDPAAAPVRAVAAAELAGRWYVAAADFGGQIEVWDAEAGESIWTQAEAHPTQVRSLAVLPLGDRVLLASGGGAGGIRLWNLADGELLAETVEGHSGPVATLCPVRAAGSLWLASGGADRSVRLWDPAAIEHPVSTIPNAHDAWVRAVSQVTFDEPVLLASGGEEGNIRLWQVKDGQLVRNAHGPSIRGFRDRPAKSDLLDRQVIASELYHILRPEAVDPDPAEPTVPDSTSGPQVVLIEGAWGTGKSSLMRDLRERLDPAEPPAVVRWSDRVRRRWQRRELSPGRVNRLVKTGKEPQVKPRPVQNTVTAWFNPWAHQSSEQVWAGLAWTIIDETRGKLGTSEADRQHYWLSRNLSRLDRGALRRIIRQRIWRATYTTLGVLSGLLAISMVRLNSSTKSGLSLSDPGAAGWPLLVTSAAAVLVLLCLSGYALWQYFFGKATAHLPADVFEGPVDQTSIAAVTGERLLRDPPYLSTAGHLYRINQDLHRLAKDLEKRGYQLVVFVDDLDRCTSASTAEVFEAINSFLSDQNFPEAAPRFVIGLDPGVVAARLAAAYAEPGAVQPAPDADDPNPGWAIMRKLSQLTVVLPGIRATHTVRLLRAHSVHAAAEPARVVPSAARGQRSPSPPASAPPRVPVGPSAPAGSGSSAAASGPRPGPHEPDPPGRVDPARPANGEFVALESEQAVQQHLRELIALRPRQSMRETKRLLTLWAFYMRLLSQLLPPDAVANVRDARDAMTLAEVVRRWPALVPALGRLGDGPSGLSSLITTIAAGATEPQSPTWQAALARIGLAGVEYGPATTNLHRLLRTHGTPAVAGFADRLL